MAEGGIRVALLARPGKARDQLHAALSEAGASIVAEGDPTRLDPGEVAAAAPNYFLISLEPAIEAALERFDDLLAAPGVEVMFDDAEVTARLDGWDLNRWARHIATKMLGNEALPPVPEGTPSWTVHELSEAGAPPTPAQLMDDARLEDYTADTEVLADSVPVSASLATPDMGLDLDLELSALELGSPAGEAVAAPTAPTDFGDLDFDESVSFSSFAPVDPVPGDLDADVAELAAQLEAFDQADRRFGQVEAMEPASRATLDALLAGAARGATEEIVMVEAVAVAAPSSAPTFDFSNLALAPMEVEPPGTVAAAAAPALSLELEDVAASPQAASTMSGGQGAVVILAGLGGPDAVRQLLSSLPETLSVPVLLYQHLEVGKHERLVDQLAKISKLPVVLARDGGSPEGGKVTLLPAGMTAHARGAGLGFGEGTLTQLLESVSAAESMVIVLSGADAQLVPAILSVREAGGLVLAQDPEVCFDSAAADAMQREGAPVYPALGLARQIAARWPA
jgi:chemotaxis response regulator CheB